MVLIYRDNLFQFVSFIRLVCNKVALISFYDRIVIRSFRKQIGLLCKTTTT